ncbi:hypothetical protein QA634_06010 [Methylobacterium sp. CB376]|uniref:hypothetical protein n=1 Tax=unclassified Methylobacterium TaxID=2615210 RepID=UPI000152CDDA|nr:MULTISPECIES: hypothetical protein [Methylobacterium]WFT81441.1 hypothetical protein QA634_06010 [Methylobacterium nodulans]
MSSIGRRLNGDGRHLLPVPAFRVVAYQLDGSKPRLLIRLRRALTDRLQDDVAQVIEPLRFIIEDPGRDRAQPRVEALGGARIGAVLEPAL